MELPENLPASRKKGLSLIQAKLKIEPERVKTDGKERDINGRTVSHVFVFELFFRAVIHSFLFA